MAASFLVLAIQKLKPGGDLGIVLPLTAALADTWAATRRHVETACQDITAITVRSGLAEGEKAFSADTHTGEMLLVGRKRSEKDAGEVSKVVRCITLRSPVLRPGEAGETARAIKKALARLKEPGDRHHVKAGGDVLGEAIAFGVPGTGEPWNYLGTVHTDVALAADGLAK